MIIELFAKIPCTARVNAQSIETTVPVRSARKYTVDRKIEKFANLPAVGNAPEELNVGRNCGALRCAVIVGLLMQ